ncbi:MAG: hypothetical protein GWM98_02230, partial [Nitrospinaceae bacterium]|nr:hypothetical protein [Nitrospinaceae bacterium]NIR53528.1 hypothetical protein [Nitrospinaceae bacterium]NIS83929.1 hypothetical protein [Nitrospinaceae bacterium]NIT80737.1 hypothetical protein [Nitrospinaceae bacterium]NIU43044.1 hypothetical protein [Nitrospinaceae bacterium]
MNRVVFSVLSGLLIWILPGASGADPIQAKTYTNNPVVAVVEGEPIMMEDLKNARIHDAMDQLHKMQVRALKEKVVESLAKKHPDFKLNDAPKVTPRDVANFYRNTPGVKELGTFAQMREEIRDYLQ